MRTALLLIALGFGFKTFVKASANPTKSVRQFGRLIGIFMMLISFIGTICTVTYTIQEKWYCPFEGKSFGAFGKMCPLTQKPLPQEMSGN